MLQRKRGRRRTGAALLEFAFVLPIFLFLITFSIDMGRMTFYSGVLHDSAFTAARAGAQVGGAGAPSNGPSRIALNEAVGVLQGGTSNVQSFTIPTGQTCATTGNNRYVTVKVNYRVSLITPGLQTLLNATASQEGPWTLRATGVSRCEIVRTS